MSDLYDRGGALRLAAGALVAGKLRFPVAHPRWRFVFVNHALTNPFFVPAKYGSADAARLLGVTATWTGSRSSDVGEMVKAMKKAIDLHADGIAVSIIDETAFNTTTELALAHGIPVVAYNADGGPTNKRLAYIGQDNYQSGLEMGARIVGLVPEGLVRLFIATPNQQNIQPRVDGALDAIRDSGKPIHVEVVASGVDVAAERKKIEATYRANTHVRGLFAVDAGSTEGVAEVMRAHGLHAKGVRAGGYDLLPATLHAIQDRHLDFTIDQQPYLQGFLPVLQLFLDRYSGGLVAPADTNTGLNFVTRANVARYLTTTSRYEGSSAAEVFPVARK
ncbi:MAG TPA: substrate-binding domain-containing protein [Gaiellaceae bacterium]|nr:substrate-binding domain-containing protein [Gaiellaceae bacterium]